VEKDKGNRMTRDRKEWNGRMEKKEDYVLRRQEERT